MQQLDKTWEGGALFVNKKSRNRRFRPCRKGSSHQLRVTSHRTCFSLPRYFITSLPPHLAQEALAMRNCPAEVLRNGLSHIPQRVPNSEVYAGAASRRIRQNRHVLPRMIRCRPSRIGVASMVCGDHQHVRETQQRQEVRKQTVELFERFCESLNVFPVAIEHVEIHQVAKNESALALTDCRRQFLHAVRVTLCGDVFFHSAAIVNVMNLANSENTHFLFRKNVHQHRPRRINSIIVPPRGPHEVSRRSGKRPRDHASHAVRPIQQFPCDFAHAVEFSDWDHVFMRGDLKHAVARRVHDWLARSYVLLTQFLDDLCAGSRLVSNRLPANLSLELFDQFLRKSFFVNRSRPPHPHSHHFPYACPHLFPTADRPS